PRYPALVQERRAEPAARPTAVQPHRHHRSAGCASQLLRRRAEARSARPERSAAVDRTAMIAPIFLSASEPDPRRSSEYWDSRKLLDLREAVLAFCAHVSPHFPIVFGGHPAITPLVRGVAERIAFDMGLEGPGREPATLPQPV